MGGTGLICSRPMLRLFSLFGRSAEQNALDDALRATGLHPLLVPEAVKLTVLRLHRRTGAAGSGAAAYGETAKLLAYCLLGHAGFLEANDTAAADLAEARVEAAVAAGESFDAKIILLALHAGLIAPDIAERFEIEAE